MQKYFKYICVCIIFLFQWHLAYHISKRQSWGSPWEVALMDLL